MTNGAGSSSGILWTFGVYMAGVFLLAWLSRRAGKREGFVSEYFLGSRGDQLRFLRRFPGGRMDGYHAGNRDGLRPADPPRPRTAPGRRLEKSDARAPGPEARNTFGFLALGMAFSFFVFWPFGGVGQPSSMVRLMAFDRTIVLRRAIVAVTLYVTFIYVSLVLIFVCARVLMPGMEIDPDRIMPAFSAHATAVAGVPWLAGIVVAAPFAAVMSSVDSFLLVMASALVRDIYQRNINPHASERRLKALSWSVTCTVGLLAMIVSLNPPEYLSDLIVSASAGLAASFMMPVILALYWQRMTAAGAMAGMLGGGGMHILLYGIGYLIEKRFDVYPLLGLQPFFWDVIVATALSVAISLASPPPPRALVHKFFA